MSIDEVEQTPVDGLFERSDVATPADDTMQWRAALLQMVNWGGFGGLTVVPLRGDAPPEPEEPADLFDDDADPDGTTAGETAGEM